MSIDLVKKYKKDMDFALDCYDRSCGTNPEGIFKVLRKTVKVLSDVLDVNESTFYICPERITEDVDVFYDKVKIFIENSNNTQINVIPEHKIKVFISSKCGDKGRYDRIRAELKKAIESTNLAEVYLFEDKEASTLTAGSHYTWALEDSDVCIFLIDNLDGIPQGVQAEIDTVKKFGIKSLYYFCAESSKEKTPLEQSLMGAKFSKSRTVDKFDELSSNSAKALINDIVEIYHYYCMGKLNEPDINDKTELQSINITGTEDLKVPTMPKTVLKNIDKCKKYILEHITGQSYQQLPEEPEKTSEIDEWGLQFLSVLLEGKTIKQFNVSMFLETLRQEQIESHFNVVQIRWQAIQEYFSGNASKCVEKLELALKIARETNQPDWIVKDILVDLRNQHWTINNIENCYSESKAQKELTESSEELYYPILDRIHESLHQKYIEGLYKEKTTSPYTITSGNLDPYGDLLASSFIVSLYNGSLTHILLFYDKLRDFLFYLSGRYDSWVFKRDMLKLAIYGGKTKDIKGLQDSYPEILNNMSPEDATLIMEYCNNHPIKYRRFISQLLGFGAVGYYLNDDKYVEYETLIVKEIKDWLNKKKPIFVVGDSIFKGLSGVSHRMSQDVLAEICCLFIDKNYSRWYVEMFEFLSKNIDLNKMSENSAKTLIEHITAIIKEGKGHEQIKFAPLFLCRFRKQNRLLTEELDKAIAKHMPKYYDGDYRLETSESEQEDMPKFVQKYVDNVRTNNKTQGINGTYFGRGVRDIAVIRSILLNKDFKCSPDIMDSVISATADTLLMSKESLRTKLDAISLLVCIVLNYTDDYHRNALIFEKLYDQKEIIEAAENAPIFSNIDRISLNIGLQLLYTAMDKDTYSEILEVFPYLQNDIATTISVVNLMVEYLELNDSVRFPQNIEIVVLQNVLHWLRSDNLDIRWGATRIMFALIRNPENQSIINHQLITLIESQNVYIKNLILRNVISMNGVTNSTKKYIVSKCENDANYVVRMVCGEMKEQLAK